MALCVRVRQAHRFRGSSVVEQLAVNQLVIGSNPIRGAMEHSSVGCFYMVNPCGNLWNLMLHFVGVTIVFVVYCSEIEVIVNEMYFL